MKSTQKIYSTETRESPGVDSSNDDEFMKYLKTDNSDFDDSSTALPEFDYATSLSSKDVPKHESMFGQDKMETYDQNQK